MPSSDPPSAPSDRTPSDRPPSERAESADDPGVPGDYCVVVPVANPGNVEQLTWTACGLAAAHDGRIRVVSAVSLPPQTPLSAGRDRADQNEAVVDRALATAAEYGVPASGGTPASHDPARTILDAVDEEGADAVLLGWHGDPGEDRRLLASSTVGRIRESADCAVYVEKIGPGATGPVGSILVPTAGGPHADLAVETAGALAGRLGAGVTLTSVVSATAPPAKLGAERERLAALAERLDVPVDAEVRTARDTADELVAAAGDHDLTVIGATEVGGVRRRIAGAVTGSVVRRAPSTVLVARAAGTPEPTGLDRLLAPLRRDAE